MLAMEMKASGKYVSRGLSFKDAEFEQHVVTLTKDQRKMYDDACGMISLIRSACIEAARRTGVEKKSIWSAYWSVHQRFFKLLCISMKVPEVIAAKRTRRLLADIASSSVYRRQENRKTRRLI